MTNGRPGMQDLAGKTAFITGGGSGIGLGIAKVLAREGMHVAVADVRQESVDHTTASLGVDGRRALGIVLDVTDRKAFAEAAHEVEQVMGPLHVLCCNAEVCEPGRIKDAEYADWDWIMGVTLGGVVNGIRAFLPGMLRHGQPGHVLATASMAGLVPRAHGGIYSVGKAAVVGLIEALRMELASTRLGVSVICPGATRTNIGTTPALRPARFQVAGRPGLLADAPPSPEVLGLRQEMQRLAMDPLEVGEKVLRGMRRNDLYILPHAEFAREIRGHMDDIIAAMPPSSAGSVPATTFPTPYATALGSG